jgi:hypothetical protein
MLGHHPILVEKRPTLGGLQADSPYLNDWVPMLPRGTCGQRVAATMNDTLHQEGVRIGDPQCHRRLPAACKTFGAVPDDLGAL